MANLTETLRTLQELRSAATPGPWSAQHRCDQHAIDDNEVLGMGLDLLGPPQPDNDGMFAKAADAKFIVAAANVDFEDMAAEVERLRERNAKLVKLVGESYREGWFHGVKRGEKGLYYTTTWQQSEAKKKRDQLKAGE